METLLQTLTGDPDSIHPDSMSVIITVPHAVCEDSEGRTCDTRAYGSGLLVESILEDQNFKQVHNLSYDTSIVFNDTLRRITDGNRYASRNTKFRRQIRNLLKRDLSKSHLQWIIDVHSFPNTPDSFGTMPDGTVPKFVILSPPEHYQIYKKFEEMITFDFPKIKSNYVRVLLASDKNDIMEEGRDYHTSGILIEFNEDTDYLTPDEQKQITQAFLSFLFNAISGGEFVPLRAGNIVLNLLLQVVCLVILILLIYTIIRTVKSWIYPVS